MKDMGSDAVMRISKSGVFMKSEFPIYVKRFVQKTLDEHGHEFIELVFVERGRGIHRFQESAYEIKAGDVFIINPGETHSYVVEEGEQMDIINCLFMTSLIPDTLLRELGITASMDYFYVHPFLKSDVRFNHRLNLRGKDAEIVLGLLDSMIRELESQSQGYTTLVRLQLIELLVVLSRHYTLLQKQKASAPSRASSYDMTAKRIYGYMERNYESKITLQSLANLYNVSVRQLNRLMGQEFGKSVIDVLHEIRINRAKHLLGETHEKVIVVATMVGYEDPSFFSRLFHRHVGCSPSQYRARVER